MGVSETRVAKGGTAAGPAAPRAPARRTKTFITHRLFVRHRARARGRDRPTAPSDNSSLRTSPTPPPVSRRPHASLCVRTVAKCGSGSLISLYSGSPVRGHVHVHVPCASMNHGIIARFPTVTIRLFGFHQFYSVLFLFYRHPAARQPEPPSRISKRPRAVPRGTRRASVPVLRPKHWAKGITERNRSATLRSRKSVLSALSMCYC